MKPYTGTSISLGTGTTFLLDLSEDETVEAKNTSSVLDLVLTFYALDRDGQIDFGAVRHRVASRG